MPRGDKTGPFGQGPQTGRGAGFCAGYDVAGYQNRGLGRRLGLGRGSACRRGFGNAWRTGAPVPAEQRGQEPPAEASFSRLTDLLDRVSNRLESLEKKLARFTAQSDQGDQS